MSVNIHKEFLSCNVKPSFPIIFILKQHLFHFFYFCVIGICSNYMWKRYWRNYIWSRTCLPLLLWSITYDPSSFCSAFKFPSDLVFLSLGCKEDERATRKLSLLLPCTAQLENDFFEMFLIWNNSGCCAAGVACAKWQDIPLAVVLGRAGMLMGWHPPHRSWSQAVFMWNGLVPLGNEVTKKTLDQNSTIVRTLHALLQSLAQVWEYCDDC